MLRAIYATSFARIEPVEDDVEAFVVAADAVATTGAPHYPLVVHVGDGAPPVWFVVTDVVTLADAASILGAPIRRRVQRGTVVKRPTPDAPIVRALGPPRAGVIHATLV
jgi:hypothetical protein